MWAQLSRAQACQISSLGPQPYKAQAQPNTGLRPWLSLEKGIITIYYIQIVILIQEGLIPPCCFVLCQRGVTRRDAPPHLLVLQLKEMTTYKGHPSLPYVVSTKVRGGAA